MGGLLPLLLVVASLATCYGQGLHQERAGQESGSAVRVEAIKGKHRPIGPGTDTGLYSDDRHEGDIHLLRSLNEEDGTKEVAEEKNAVANLNLLWSYATLPFKVEDDVGCPESPQCSILMEAMEHYHEKSCVRFKEWTGEKDYILVFFNQDSGACWSPVGRSGGEQKVSLGERCWYHGIVVHELGHSIGFWHEMNRPDRDDWISIYWQNILPGFSTAFSKYSTAEVNSLGEKFDYRSIMMYDEYAFSKDGTSPTLQATTGVEIGPIWKKSGLSQSDIRRLQRLYKCDGNKPKSGFPYDIICNFNSHTCGFMNGGSSVWNWRTVNDTDGYVYSSYEVAGTTVGRLVSVGLHPLQPEDERGPMGCLRFWYLVQPGGGQATLKLTHAYLDRVTQFDEDPDMMFELWMNNETSPMAEANWVHVEVPVYMTRPFRLIFESEFDSDNTFGTIALDDVEIIYSECPINEQEEVEGTASQFLEGDTQSGLLESSAVKPIGNLYFNGPLPST